MSFRVWFLRMVWIVAAAVALSGCDDDEKKTDTPEQPSDGPKLAIASIAPVTMGDGNEMAAIKVTIDSEDKDDKTAEVTLTVTCGGTEVKLDDNNKKKKAVDGVADFGNVDLGDHTEATTCKVTAEAKLGDTDVKKDATFEIKAAGAAGDGASVTSVSFLKEDGTAFAPDGTDPLTEDNFAKYQIQVELSEALASEDKITLVWACVNSSDDAAIGIETQPSHTMSPAGNDSTTHTAVIGEGLNAVLTANHAPAKCTVTAKVGSETGKAADIWVTGAD